MRNVTIALLVMAAMLVQVDSAYANDDFWILVYVEDNYGQPIEGADIYKYGFTGKEIIGRTGEDGFSDPLTGVYPGWSDWLHVQHWNYNPPGWWDYIFESEFIEPVTQSTILSFVGWPADYWISGRVLTDVWIDETTTDRVGYRGLRLFCTRDDGYEKLTHTDENGYYKFWVPPGWSGTVSYHIPTIGIHPWLPSFLVSPESRSYTGIYRNEENQDFYRAAPLLWGYVKTSNGCPIADTRIDFTNGDYFRTDADGFYNKRLWCGKEYTIFLEKSGYTFDPGGEVDLGPIDPQVDDIRMDFLCTSVPEEVSISGEVRTEDGTGVSGVEMNFSDGESTGTFSDGHYYETVYTSTSEETVTPSHPDYAFVPPSRSYPDGFCCSLDDQDFIAKQKAIYVDVAAMGANDGSSWYNAFNCLQDALGNAISGQEIWVAEGTYRPDQGINQVAGDREATFLLVEDVAIYGGFDGTETGLAQRDVQNNETILSGDIGIVDDDSDNSYHVVTGSGTDETAVLDGFTINGGNADGWQPNDKGAGMYNNGGSPTVANCTFTGNSASAFGYGGGMYNEDSSDPKVTNCTFSGNEADWYGGGMYNSESSPTVTNCTFSGNSTDSVGGKGGGMYNISFSNPIITNCTFSGNSADATGGGMHNYSNCNTTLTNCTFIGNTARWGGGILAYNSSPTLTNCTFSGNSATSESGGGMSNEGGNPTITNCTFSGNHAARNGGGMYNYDGSPTVTNCILWGNTAANGDEIYNSNSTTPVISHCDIAGSGGSGGGWDNALGTDVGGNIDDDPLFVSTYDLHLQTTSFCIDAGDNSAVTEANDLDGGPRIIDGDNDGISTVDMGAYESIEPILDSDGDGIEDSIDTEPTVYSNDFSDAETTYGTITDRGDQILTITDEPDPDGVRIKADAAGGGTTPATVSFCDGSYIVDVWPGDYIVRGCSFEINVISGTANVTLVDAVTTSLAAGNGLTFQAATFTITVPPTNSDVVVLLFQGAELYLAPGETLILNQPPVAEAGDNQIVEQESYAGTEVTLDGSGSTDPDSTPGTNDDIASFDWYQGDTLLASGETIDYTFPLGNHVVTLLVTDSSGETDSDKAIIVVQDTTPPVIACPVDVTLECPANTSTAATGLAVAMDNCDPSPTIVFSDLISGACQKIIERTWSATDASGNSSTCIQTITVIDTTPPVITCPLDVILECPADTSVAANGSATATDACGSFTVTYSDASVPGCGNTEMITRTWTATDECGNSSSCVQVITVVDTTPPVITCPGNVTLECPADTSVAANGSATATDACGSVTVTYSDASVPGCGNTETITRTWTATDECGNSSTCVQIITIVDTTQPVINCPADVTLECPADTSVAANGSATAGDTGSSVAITHNDVWQPGCGNTGTLTRTWTATDECGNRSTCVQTITVVDTTPPEFEFSVTPTVLWPANHKMVKITPTWTVSDECDASPEVSLVGIVMNEGDKAKGSGHTTDDIQIDDDGSIYLRAERSGKGRDRIYTITYQAVDGCGNATESSATVTVPHDKR